MTRSNRYDADGVLQNFVTKIGTRRSHSSNNTVGNRLYFRRQELDVLDQEGLIKRLNGELPADAAIEPNLETDDGDAEAVLEALRQLNTLQTFRRAGYVARGWGGAAVWIVCEGGGAPWEPLDLSSVKGVRNLVVINRFELNATMPYDNDRDRNPGHMRTLFEDDPRKPGYGEPEMYYYTPINGGTPARIHASRLIRFEGLDVPEALWDLYEGWGAPVVESVWRRWSQVIAGLEGGAELLQEAGHIVYNLGNLQEIMSGTQRDQLSEWMSLQREVKSVLGGTVLGPGQTADRMEYKITGWVDILDRLLQMLASEAGYPITKLYGQAPGGLSTDDASAWRNWGAAVDNYKRDQLTPAYSRLIEVLCASSEGPTQGRPDLLKITWDTYEAPTRKDEGETANLWADATGKMITQGAITPDEARDTLAALDGVRLRQDEEKGAEPNPSDVEALANALVTFGGAEAGDRPEPIDGELVGESGQGVDALGATASGVEPQKTAFNGAQVASLQGIVTAVYAGELPADSAIQMITVAYPVSIERARDIVGDGPQASAPRPPAEGAARRADDDGPAPLDETHTPPQAVQRNAQRALDVRDDKPESERGMGPTGLARARDLSNGRPVSIEVMREMWPWFERHEVDKQGDTWDDEGKGWQAWNGWGGDEGRAWVIEVLEAAGHLVEDDDGERGLIPVTRGDDRGTEASEPADPAEQIEGSDDNPDGSASDTRGGIEITEEVEQAIANKVETHNETHGAESKKVDAGMLKAVWRRGAGAYSTSHDPNMSRTAWAMARVNAFLELVAEGEPSNPDYTTDFDLLPDGHPKKPEERGDRFDYGPRSMMLALPAPPAWQAAYAPYSLHDPEDFHATLIYLDDVGDAHAEAVIALTEALLAEEAPLTLHPSGPGLFTNASGIARVVLVSGHGLTDLRSKLARGLAGAGLLTKQTHDFIPHMTLGYHETMASVPMAQLRAVAETTVGGWRADRVTCWRGGDCVATLPIGPGRLSPAD